jgi:tetratricopeptide (TPR) repeat protein
MIRSIFLLLMLWASLSFAQQPGSKVERAKSLFQEAEALYALQKYEEALQKYEETYVLIQEPELFFNIGQCYRILGKPAEAAKSYRNYLIQQPNSPERTAVEELIANMDALVARGLTPTDLAKAARSFEDAEVHYKLQEYQAALKGYEESYRLSKEPDLLFNIAQCYRQLGKKQEAVRGYRSYLRENPNTKIKAQVEENIATLEQEIALEAKSQPASQPTTINRTFKITEKISPAGALYGVAGTLGGSWLVTGGIAWALTAKADKLANPSPDEPILPDQIKELEKQVKTLALISDLSLGLAIGSAVGGVILSKRDKDAPKVQVAPSSGGAVAKVSFSW